MLLNQLNIIVYQRCIEDPVKHLRLRFLQKQLTIFAKSSISDVWQGSSIRLCVMLLTSVIAVLVFPLWMPNCTLAIALILFTLLMKSSVISQKGESQSGCFKKTNHPKFSKKRTFLTPWNSRKSQILPQSYPKSFI